MRRRDHPSHGRSGCQYHLCAVIDPEMKDSIRITVIATGFDVVKEQTMPVAEDGKTLEFPKRTYDRDDLDIPAFLRRSRQA